MFVYKSTAEIEAMSEYQREKYFDQKREHETAEAGKVAKEAAEKAVAAGLSAVKSEIQTNLESVEKTTQEKLDSIGTIVDEMDKKYEQALTDLNRAKSNHNENRKRTMKGEIYEALEKAEEQHKAYAKSKTPFDLEVKAVGVMGVPTGTVAEDWQPAQSIPNEMVHARNVIPVSPTQSNMIKYLRYTKKEGAPAPVAAGAAKPQFDYTVTPQTAPVRKIAGFLQLHDEFLEDIVGSRDFIASELPQALLDVEDFQIFKGPGTGENLQGIMTVADELTLPLGLVTAASNAWDKLAAGLTQVRLNLRAANAIWVSPIQYLELLINKGNTLEYTYPGMNIVQGTNGQLYLGGVPIYQHTVFADGEALIGDFARGTRIFQKMAAVIKFSTEHATNFTTNQTTVLIEERIALPIYYPDGFVKIDMLADPEA